MITIEGPWLCSDVYDEAALRYVAASVPGALIDVTERGFSVSLQVREDSDAARLTLLDMLNASLKRSLEMRAEATK